MESSSVVKVASAPEPSFVSAVAPCVSAAFTVSAEAEPSVLSRVVEYFVVLDSLPDSVRLRRYEGGHMEITLKVRGLDEARCELVAHKLRQIVMVHQVQLEIFAVGGDIYFSRENKARMNGAGLK